VIPLLKLFRTGNAVMGVIGLFIGVLIATGTDILDHWQPIAWTALAVMSETMTVAEMPMPRRAK